MPYLVLQFFSHNSLCVGVVQVSEVDQGLSHVLVHVDGVGVFHELTNNLALDNKKQSYNETKNLVDV